MRSVGAAIRASERDAQRRHKAALRMQAMHQKAETQRLSAEAVEDWEDYIAELISVHVDLADALDWQAMAAAAEPTQPQLGQFHTLQADKALSSFKPSMFDFFRGGSKKLRADLEGRRRAAIERDEREYQADIEAYPAAVSEWNEEVGFARRVLSQDHEAWFEVLRERSELSKHDLIGSKVVYSIIEGRLNAVVSVHGNDIIPSFERRLLASGKHSDKKMPAGRFNELYQDYVASVALKVSGDTFHILPTEEVWVICVSSMLNTVTGYKEATPILSAQFVRRTFVEMNLEAIDPSDALQNFRHSMDFKKTKGFAPIAPLLPLT